MTAPPKQADDVVTDGLAPVRIKAGSVRWEARSPEVAEVLEALLRDPDRLTRQNTAAIHSTWLVTVVRLSLPRLGGSWLMRRSNYAKSSAQKRDFFRTAASVRAFRNALALEQAGLPTPRVLAAGVHRVLRVPRAGYLVVEEVPKSVSLARFAESPQGLSRKAIQGVAEAIARLHERGFVHGDLTINNVLLDDAGRPWLIDLERTRRVIGAVNWRQAIEDFHRFARHFSKFSPAGRWGALRLLKEYCAARGWRGREREFINALERRLRHKIAADRAGGE